MAAIETVLADIGPVVQGNNILLFVILILLFVIGYKILQTVIRLGLVAVLSGVFLVALSIIGIGPEVTVQRFILFMVLGTGLFIFYSTLATAVSLLDTGYAVLSGIIAWAFNGRNRNPRSDDRGWIKRLVRKVEEQRNQTETVDIDSKEKEIVLDEIDADE